MAQEGGPGKKLRFEIRMVAITLYGAGESAGPRAAAPDRSGSRANVWRTAIEPSSPGENASGELLRTKPGAHRRPDVPIRFSTTMMFEALTLAAIVNELHDTLVGGRLASLHQVDAWTLLLIVAKKEDQHQILLSIDPQLYRVHLAFQPYPHSNNETFFTRTVRELCRNALITSVSQPDLDRIVILHLHKRGSLLHAEMNITVELMGRLSNAILTQGHRENILSSWRQVDATMCRYRQIVPGRPYAPPPAPPGLNPLQSSLADFQACLESRFNAALPEALSQCLRSVGPPLACDLLRRAGLQDHGPVSSLSAEHLERLWNTVVAAFEGIRTGAARPLFDAESGGRIRSLSSFDDNGHGQEQRRPAGMVSRAIEEGYARLIDAQKQSTLAGVLRTALEQKRKHWQRTLAHLHQEYEQAHQDRERRRLGELITANMNILKRGMTRAQVIDYFHPEQPTVTIELDPQRSPQENAQVHFRRAHKAHKAMAICGARLKEASFRLAELEAISQQLQQVQDPRALNAIAEKVRGLGLLLPERRASASSSRKGLPFRRFTTASGWRVFVGRNNKENDQLTFQFAAPTDLWLHARGVAGSHVLIRREGNTAHIDQGSIEEAAGLAAYYSKGRGAAMVPVSYTERRYVRKPKGAPPGMVLIEREKTIFVEPKALKPSEAELSGLSGSAPKKTKKEQQP